MLFAQQLLRPINSYHLVKKAIYCFSHNKSERRSLPLLNKCMFPLLSLKKEKKRIIIFIYYTSCTELGRWNDFFFQLVNWCISRGFFLFVDDIFVWWNLISISLLFQRISHSLKKKIFSIFLIICWINIKMHHKKCTRDVQRANSMQFYAIYTLNRMHSKTIVKCAIHLV